MAGEIVFITGNPNKAKELQAYASVPILHREFKIPELQSPVLQDVARAKAKEAYRILLEETGHGIPVLTEDTALTFDAWKTLPGTFIKHFMDSVGNDGLVRMLGRFENRNAVASTAFALCTDGTYVILFDGSTRGSIARSPRGDKGFAWDPIFVPDSGDGSTWGEMSPEEKQKDSMRAKAILKFERHLKSQSPTS